MFMTLMIFYDYNTIVRSHIVIHMIGYFYTMTALSCTYHLSLIGQATTLYNHAGVTNWSHSSSIIIEQDLTVQHSRLIELLAKIQEQNGCQQKPLTSETQNLKFRPLVLELRHFLLNYYNQKQFSTFTDEY